MINADCNEEAGVGAMAVMLAGLALALAGQAGVPGTAAPAGEEATCPAGATAPATPPAPYTGWDAMQGVTAGASLASPASLAVGRSARAALVPAADLHFPVAPEKPATAGTSGGVFAFDVNDAGTYRVALGAAPWVDVVAGGKVLASVAHGHGPDCSGVRKFVDYRLTPGRYLLQVSGNKAAVLMLMVARLT